MDIKPRTGAGYKVLLLLVDLGLAYLALWMSLNLRYPDVISLEVFLQHAQPFTLVYLTWIVLFYLNNLYNFIEIRDQLNVYFDLARTLLLGTILAIIVFYILPSSDLTPKRLLVINAGIFAILVAIWRMGFVKLFSSLLPKNNVAIIGINRSTLALGRSLISAKNSGYRLAALVGDGSQKVSQPTNIQDIDIVENPYAIAEYIRARHINTVVLAESNLDKKLTQHLFQYLSWGVKFYDLADFYENFTHKIPVTQLNHGWFLNNINESEKKTYDILKRLIDIMVSIVLLMLLSPIILLIALIIPLESRGSIIYKQERIGKNDQPFTLYKFRTMVEDAEKYGPQWSRKENDPRLTKFGKFLGKTRLNELPQLINILKGEMSLIGPRPERQAFMDELSRHVPFYQTRHLVKPGLSGWAQVKFSYGASIEDALEKHQYDLYYIKHRSMSLDLSIAIRTVLVVLSLKGI
jgi:exopolysaccharide biosynthesis polyprenyl glycosylphosphotransferase